MIMIDIDMPDNCDECRFNTECGFCKAMPDNFCGNTDSRKRPEWCPLKEQEQKWISVEDRLPEIRHAVLAYSPFHKNIWAVSMHEDEEWYYWIPTSEKYDPDWEGPITHWMPLPEIPDDQKEAITMPDF